MKLRYQVRYYRNILTVLKRPSKPDAFGSSSELDNLIRNAAGRCAIENYRMAVIVTTTKAASRSAFCAARQPASRSRRSCERDRVPAAAERSG